MTSFVVAGGQTSSGIALQPGDVLTINAGGTASSTQVLGLEQVYGSSVQDVVGSGGVLSSFEGASITSAVLLDGGIEQAGYIGFTGFGGAPQGHGGGLSVATHILSGGVAYIDDSKASSTVIEAGGVQSLFYYASGTNDVVSSGGTQTVYYDSVAIDTAVQAGGSELVLAYGLEEVTSGWTTSGAIISNAGQEVVSAGGTGAYTVVSAGGTLVAQSGAVISGTQVLAGGTATVQSGALAQQTTVSAGGTQIVSAGGTASNSIVLGTERDYGSAAYDNVGSSGTVYLYSSTVMTSAVIASGGVEQDGLISYTGFGFAPQGYIGGSAIATDILSGGIANIDEASASNTLIENGGVQAIIHYGSATATNIKSGGLQTVYDHSIASNTVIASGGTQSVTDATAIDTSIANGGNELVYTGGTKIISSGWTTTGAQIVGGAEIVSAGGVALRTSASSGGVISAQSGAVTSASQLLAAGTEIVLLGAQALATTIASGGTQTVQAGASASDTAVHGTEYVSGASVHDTVFSGGVLNEYTGAVVSNAVLSSGATEQNGLITFTGFGFSPQGYGGGNSISAIVLSGAADNIDDATATDTQIAGGVQTLIYYATATGAQISAGGEQIVSDGSTVTSTTISSGGTLVVGAGGAATDVIFAGGTLDLTTVGYLSAATPSLNPATDVLTINGSVQVQLAGDYTGDTFYTSNDGQGGTDVTVNHPGQPGSAAPTITGTVAGQTTRSEQPVTPFATVTVTDGNAGATDTLTIKETGAGGTLAGAGLSQSNGVYLLSGTAADVTAELRALVFTPTPLTTAVTNTTHFLLTDSSTGLATDNTASVIDTATSFINNGTINAGPNGILIPQGIVSATNTSAGYIYGGSYAVVDNYGTSLTNAGRLHADGTGVKLGAPGQSPSLDNTSTGSIYGGLYGVWATTNTGSMVNAGQIGSYNVGVELDAGGTFTNAATGTITGSYAVYTKDVAATIVNAGTIHGIRSPGAGVYLQAGGTVTNQATGVITGSQYGVYAAAAATVVNTGSIGGGASGVWLNGGGTLVNGGTVSGATHIKGSGTLVIEPGAVFNGAVNGSGSGTRVVELASAASAGTVGSIGTAASGAAINGFSQVNLDAGASWTLTGAAPMVFLGGGGDSLTTGAGAVTIVAGPTTTGADTVHLGAGLATIDVAKNLAATITVTGITGNDVITFTGFGTGATLTALGGTQYQVGTTASHEVFNATFTNWTGHYTIT